MIIEDKLIEMIDELDGILTDIMCGKKVLDRDSSKEIILKKRGIVDFMKTFDFLMNKTYKRLEKSGHLVSKFHDWMDKK